MEDHTADYYLEVVKVGKSPKWPLPEEELIVGHQSLDDNFIQYWAYPKDGGREADDLPPAEVVASENQVDQPAIIIDQPKGHIPLINPNKEDEEEEESIESTQTNPLELILVQNGHAWGRTQTSLENLDDNIFAVLDFAQNEFNMKVEHFMTTPRVSEEVEEKMNKMEEEGIDSPRPEPKEEVEKPMEKSFRKPQEPETAVPEEEVEESTPARSGSAQAQSEHPLRPASAMFDKPLTSSGISSRRMNLGSPQRSEPGGSSKFWILLVMVIIIATVVGGIVFRGEIFSAIGIGQATPTPTQAPAPTQAPTPTPTPSVDRSQYKIRVLNGTKTTGAAATLADTLKTKGWEILSTGNATNSATPQTEIRIKKGLENTEVLTQVLTADLTSSSLQATTGAQLKPTDKADAEVVIGKE